MNRTETLQQHFSEWKTKFFLDQVFYQDGIINEQLYDSASNKILFIAKEPNAPNHTGNETRSFCEEWNNTRPTYGFALRIAEWSYGILNDFPPFSTITVDNKYEALKRIAFLNCKKTGDEGQLKEVSEFQNLVKEQAKFIKKQIEIVNPEIVILCLSHSEYLRDLLFPEAADKWVNSGYEVKIAQTENYKLIDFYHPSSRNVAPASYSLLQNVFKSEVFNQPNN